MVIREAKKRREAEEAYAAADRPELAEKERAESAVLADYLPQQLERRRDRGDRRRAPSPHTGAAELGMKGMGKVMGVVTPQTKGKADGGAVAAEVRTSAGRSQPDALRSSGRRRLLRPRLLLLLAAPWRPSSSFLGRLLLGLGLGLPLRGDLLRVAALGVDACRSCRTATTVEPGPATSRRTRPGHESL